MGATGDEAKLDQQVSELVKEAKAARKMATWQLVAILLSPVLGVVAALVESASAVVLLAFVVPVVVVVAIFVTYPSGTSGNGQWYEWVAARERARVLSERYGVYGFGDVYMMALRMHYQFALVEGRKELASISDKR